MLFIATGQANFAIYAGVAYNKTFWWLYRDDKKMKFCIRTKLRPTKKKLAYLKHNLYCNI